MSLHKRILCLWAFLGVLCLAAPVIAEVNGTVSPIIGVLAQEVYPDTLIAKTYNATSYIAASYVKFVEGAGGRVVPIWIGRKKSYYESLLQKINGVLLPGGGTFFNETNGYGDAGEHLIRIAKQINDNGTFFPVWGTCLGMELLVLKMSDNHETRIDCQSQGQVLPLEFKTDYKQSRLFADASADIITKLSSENITYNYHRYCYTEKSFDNPPLNNSWRIMSLNHDLQGTEFVSSLEHIKYPFYGVQFHPEKALYEFVSAKVPHSNSAVHVSQYFADFFMSEARRNPNTFKNVTEQMRSLIYNYDPKYTALSGSGFTQQYLFNLNVDTDFEGDDDPFPIIIPPRGGGAVSHTLGLATVVVCAFSALFAVRRI